MGELEPCSKCKKLYESKDMYTMKKSFMGAEKKVKICKACVADHNR